MAVSTETLAPGAFALVVSGRLERADIDAAMEAIRTAKLESGKISVLVDLRQFSGFDVSGLIEDLRRGLGELRDISRYDRIAVVTDREWMSWMAKAEGALLPGVKIRTFQPEQHETARKYVLGEAIVEAPREPGMRIIPTDRPDALAFAVVGRLTGEDTKAFNQILAERLERHQQIDVLVRLDGRFPDFDPALLFSSNTWAAKFDAWKKMRRYALIGAPQLLGGATDFLGAMLPFEVRTFTAGQEAEAWDWIGARQSPAPSA